MEEFDLLNDRDFEGTDVNSSPINEPTIQAPSINEATTESIFSSLGVEEMPLFEFPQPQINLNLEIPEDVFSKFDRESLALNETTSESTIINQSISNFSELTSKALNDFSENISNSFENVSNSISESNESITSSLDYLLNTENISSENNVNLTSEEFSNAFSKSFLNDLSEKININNVENNSNSLTNNESVTSFLEKIVSSESTSRLESNNTRTSENTLDLLEVSRNQESLRDIIPLREEKKSAPVENKPVATTETQVTTVQQEVQNEVSKQLAIEKSTEPVKEIEVKEETQPQVYIDISSLEMRLARIEKVLMSPLEVKIIG